MTKQQFVKRYKEVLKQVNATLVEKAERAISSGCIDLKNAEDNYRLPKNVLCAVLRDAENEIRPLRMSDKKEINNIYKFI